MGDRYAYICIYIYMHIQHDTSWWLKCMLKISEFSVCADVRCSIYQKCLLGFFSLNKLHHLVIWVLWYCRRKSVFLLYSWKSQPSKLYFFCPIFFSPCMQLMNQYSLASLMKFHLSPSFLSHTHTDDYFCSPASAAQESQVLLLSWASLKHNELHTEIKPVDQQHRIMMLSSWDTRIQEGLVTAFKWPRMVSIGHFLPL